VYASLITGALVLATAGTSPRSALFLFELNGIPVGTVELHRDGARYRYTSVHLLTREGSRDERRKSVTFELDSEGRDLKSGRYLEALTLLEGRPGCVDAIPELGGRESKLCIERQGDSATGTVGGQPLRARYGADGLRLLELGTARFRRVPAGTKVAPPPDVFAHGFLIEGQAGPLALEPPVSIDSSFPQVRPTTRDAALKLSRVVAASFESNEAAADCVEHSRGYLERAKAAGFDAFIVHGLVVLPDDTVARPHAWVQVQLEDGAWFGIDPTLQMPVTPATHLRLGVAMNGERSGAGEAWLRLMSGEARVIRRHLP